ncbi:hypothetical protein LINPERPRIM_LOCUS23436 [Linum perenne]
MSPTWSLREPRRPQPEYDNVKDSGRFTIHMFSQGKLRESYYETEEVDFFDYVDRDRMSIFEIDKMMLELRLEGKMAYTWLYPGKEICNGGLRCLDSDADVLAMAKVIKEKDLKIVKMYIIHLTDEEANLKLEQMQADLIAEHAYPKRFATIEELPDDVDVQEPQLKQVLAIEWVNNEEEIIDKRAEEHPNERHIDREAADVEQEVPIHTQPQEVPIDTPTQEVPIHTQPQEVPVQSPPQEIPVHSPQQEIPITEMEDQSTENPREDVPVDSPPPEVPITEMEDQSKSKSTVMEKMAEGEAPVLFREAGTEAGEKPEKYVDPSLKVEAALRSYAYAIHPLNDSSQWIRSEGPRIRPPTLPRNTSGPKQKKRRREAGELLQQKKNKLGQNVTTMNRTGMPMRCGLCGEEGHNRRRCHMNKGVDGEQTHDTEIGDINLNINPVDEVAREPIDLNTSVFPEVESSSPRAGTSTSGFTFIPNPSHPRSKLGVNRGRGGGRS